MPVTFEWPMSDDNWNIKIVGLDYEQYVGELSSIADEIDDYKSNLIVRFLVSHTHAYPGLAPLPITEDGTQVNDILFELQNAVNKILNENIRLN